MELDSFATPCLPCHPMPARIPCPWDFPGKNTGVSCRSLLQGIFLTQGSNPHLLHCRQILYHWATREAPGLALTMRIFPQQSKLKSWKNHYCTYLSIRREGKLHHIEAENSLQKETRSHKKGAFFSFIASLKFSNQNSTALAKLFRE